MSVDLGHQRIRGEPRPDGLRDLTRRRPARILLDGSIRKCDLHVRHRKLVMARRNREQFKLTEARGGGQTVSSAPELRALTPHPSGEPAAISGSRKEAQCDIFLDNWQHDSYIWCSGGVRLTASRPGACSSKRGE